VAKLFFNFDPGEAGQKAAVPKTFAEDSEFVANTFVVVAPDGLDPSDLRQHRGDATLAEFLRLRRHCSSSSSVGQSPALTWRRSRVVFTRLEPSRPSSLESRTAR